MKRILFVSEYVTLAQMVRLVALADSLDPARYEVHFAASAFPDFIFGARTWRRWPLYTLPAEKVFAAVEAGRRLYGRRTLDRYIRADLEIIEAIAPDLVVGDLRWSLTVSAQRAHVPHAALINAYWSPSAQRDSFPLPDHPIVRLLGEDLAAKHFPKALPFVFKHFAAPLDHHRKKHGLPPLRSLLEVLMAGDHVLFADTPGLAPVKALEPHQHYLGTVLWSPSAPLPAAWQQPKQRPRVYVTLGSSGLLKLLPATLQAMAARPIDVLLSTAGRVQPNELPANVTTVDYVDGDRACAAADAVVTNGGSSTGYQALAQGKPVIGIPSNFDQYLASQAIDATGAGESIAARALTPERLSAALDRALGDAGRTRAAAAAAVEIASYDARARFAAFVARCTA